MVGAGAVAAHNPMLAEQPHVAGLAYRIGPVPFHHPTLPPTPLG